MAKKKNTKVVDAWEGLADEGGRPEVVEQLPSKGWHKWLRPYMMFAIFSLPLLLLFGTLTISNVTTGLNEVRAAQANQKVNATSPGRDVATDSLRRWLASEPAPLPGGQMVSWDGSRNIPVTKRVDDNNQDLTEKDAYTAEVDTFTVIDASGTMWTASVLVKVDPRGGAVAIGSPSLEPKVPAVSDGWDKGSPWPGIKVDASGVNDNTETAVETWAEAYTSGDPKRLLLAVGDTNGGNVYVPIKGVQAVKSKIVTAAPLVYGNNSTIIAQVELDLTWYGQPAKEGESGTPTTMDVLIQRADTASPIVVAWGAPGTGPTLSPFGNAIPARPIAPGATTAPVVSTTPSASSSPTSSASPSTTPTPTSTPS